jgi:uncharacterized protein (DUF1778 family)
MERINLRTTSAQRTLIDWAAKMLGKSRSEFILDAASRQADSVLLDQRLFALDDNAYRRFADALAAPPIEDRRLRRLLTTPPPWG